MNIALYKQILIGCFLVFLGTLSVTLHVHAEKPEKIIYISPDPLGVNPFLIMGKTGVEQAGVTYGAETMTFESGDPEARAANVWAAVNEGADIVIVLGFQFNEIIPLVAEEHPEVTFLIVDQCIDPLPQNVRCAMFREYEASFLIGAIAASLTETNHIGTVSALDIPFMHRYTDGYALGAKYVDPDVKVSTRWVGGRHPFSDQIRAKELALALAADGADHIFAATSGGDFGVFEAAQEQGVFAYGVDINQCPAMPGSIVESQVKRVDVAIVESVEAIVNEAQENVFVYGLAEQGVGLVSLLSDPPEESQCVILEYPEVLEKIKAIQEKIISGEIVIEDPMGKS